MKKVYFLFAVLALTSCRHQQQQSNTTEEPQTEEAVRCTCPPIVYLQPCNTYTEEEARKLIPVLEKAIVDNTGLEMYVDVLPKVKLPDTLKNDAKSRYRASKIINYFEDPPHNSVVALLHDDISHRKGEIADYGIQGFSDMNRHVCVASDYRVKDKSQFWKVIMHEFFHSFCKLEHCAKGDQTCLILEGPVKATEKELCKDCKNKMDYKKMFK